MQDSDIKPTAHQLLHANASATDPPPSRPRYIISPPCAMCYEPLFGAAGRETELSVLHCGHVFHGHCMTDFIRSGRAVVAHEPPRRTGRALKCALCSRLTPVEDDSIKAGKAPKLYVGDPRSDDVGSTLYTVLHYRGKEDSLPDLIADMAEELSKNVNDFPRRLRAVLDQDESEGGFPEDHFRPVSYIRESLLVEMSDSASEMARSKRYATSIAALECVLDRYTPFFSIIDSFKSDQATLLKEVRLDEARVHQNRLDQSEEYHEKIAKDSRMRIAMLKKSAGKADKDCVSMQKELDAVAASVKKSAENLRAAKDRIQTLEAEAESQSRCLAHYIRLAHKASRPKRDRADRQGTSESATPKSQNPLSRVQHSTVSTLITMREETYQDVRHLPRRGAYGVSSEWDEGTEFEEDDVSLQVDFPMAGSPRAVASDGSRPKLQPTARQISMAGSSRSKATMLAGKKSNPFGVSKAELKERVGKIRVPLADAMMQENPPTPPIEIPDSPPLTSPPERIQRIQPIKPLGRANSAGGPLEPFLRQPTGALAVKKRPLDFDPDNIMGGQPRGTGPKMKTKAPRFQ